MSAARIKLNSRYALLGRGMSSFLVVFICILSVMIFGALPFFTELLFSEFALNSLLASVRIYMPSLIKIFAGIFIFTSSLFIICPLMMGSEEWFGTAATGKSPSFYKFIYWLNARKAVRAVGFYCFLYLFYILWAVIFLTPGIALFVAAFYSLSVETIAINLLVVLLVGACVTTLTGLVFLLLTSARYFAASALFSKNPNMSIRTAIKESTALTEGQCLKIVLFKLSFLPWLPACLLILPAVYVLPYYRQACICLKLNIIRK